MVLLAALAALGLAAAFQATARAEGIAPAFYPTGPAGLNAIPTARMPEQGTAAASVAQLSPYTHAAVSIQIAPPLSLNLRRSAESEGAGSIEGGGRRPWSALDFKLRLIEEGAWRPEVSVGVDAALGHRRTASEYLVLSKRLGPFDASAGIGWGRMGEGSRIDNPLRLLSGKRFGRNRNAAGASASSPADWFTGESAGLFGGVAYRLPFLEEATIALDWNSLRYGVERGLFAFDAPEPWALGIRWAPAPWIDLGAGTAGGRDFMARLTLRTAASRLRLDPLGRAADLPPLPPHRGGRAQPADIARQARAQGAELEDVRVGGERIAARIALAPEVPAPPSMGRALHAMAWRGGREAKTLTIEPSVYGLRGPFLTLPRREVENLFSGRKGSSAEELWRAAAFDAAGARRAEGAADRPWGKSFRLRLDIAASLSEPDAGVPHRTALVARVTRPLLRARGFVWGGSARLALSDSSNQIDGLRPLPERLRAHLPGREGAGAFAGLRLGMPELFVGWTGTPAPDLHVSVAGGWLEEMYAGAGGEALWRPFGKAFALGAEGWVLLARDPDTPLAQGFLPGAGASGFVNAWYEIPGTDLTARLKAGRYLAGDFGATFGLDARFRGGAKLETFVTATQDRGRDAFGEKLPLAAGVRLTLPVGGAGARFVPEGSGISATLAPMGRREGASLENPLPLYDLTEAMSYRALAREWPEIAGRGK